MANIILQSEKSKQRGIHYQFNSSDKPIGEGGMGKVYRGLCVDERTGSTRPVAIKALNSDLPESAYQRAIREAQMQFRNDNLVEMLDYIEVEERGTTGEIRKHSYVISELLIGVSLFDIFEGKTKDFEGEDVSYAVKMLQEYKNDPEHFAITIVRSILSGLMALHDAGYIHRDIDPSNIMLTAEGHIKLIDFGIAKHMKTLTTGDKALTVAGKFMGKPEYASPELALGDISHQNQTTDIYAVGILLYQCIVGHTPFEGTRYEVLENHLKNKLPLNKVKNRSLRTVIATACEKKQEYRYQTAAQMRVAIENLTGKKRALSPAKIKMLIGGGAIIVIVLAAILTGVKYKQKKTQEEANIIAMTAKLQQEQQEARNMMEKALSEADALYQKGKLQDDNDFEQYLLSAYTAYASCLEKAQGDSVLSMYETEIRMKKDSILNDIKATQELLQSQVEGFKEAGEDFLSEQAQAKSDSLNNFLNNLP